MNNPDPGNINKLLTKATKQKFPLGNDILADVKLSPLKMKKVMQDLGAHLALLHSVKGRGFGEIDQKILDRELKLVGTHGSWYQLVVDSFNYNFKDLEEFKRAEKKAGRKLTKLSQGNRKIMEEVLGRKDLVMRIIRKNKKLLDSAKPRFLNGNVYMGSIVVKNGKFIGLADYHQPLLGDPVNELAYFSVMPEGNKYLPFVLGGWRRRVKEPNLEEKLHLYRLLTSYRKIIRRYVKHQYLEDYPEPLTIAQEELSYYNR